MIGLIVWVGAFLVVATCSGDGTEPDEGQARQTAEDSNSTVEPLRVATLNVLHGLSCPPENDFCQAADRAQLVAEGLEKADCPDLVGFQEIGPRQGQLIPEAMSRVCGGRYQLAWQVGTRPFGGQDVESPDREMVFTTLPIIERGYLDLAVFPWEAYWVRVDTTLGPVDFLTSHFASSSNNPPCEPALCPPVCPVGLETNQCNAREVVELFDSRPSARLQIASGDLNAPPGDPTVLTFTDAGYIDVWLSAGRPECDAATGIGCTSGRPRPENALDGLDVPDGRYEDRIDFVLARTDGTCDLDAQAESIFGEPLSEPFRGLYWPSDHGGLVAELRCG